MPDQVPALPAQLAVPVEPFTDAELDEYVDAVTDGDESRVPARVGKFEIDDEMRAEWAMRKCALLTAKLHEAAATAEEWHAQIDAWHTERIEHLQPRVDLFRVALEQYALNRRADDDRDKTIRLPSGSVKTKKVHDATVQVGNEEAVIAWANRNLDSDQLQLVVKVTPKVRVTELRKIVDIARNELVVWQETGEIVPGTYVLPGGRTTATVEPK